MPAPSDFRRRRELCRVSEGIPLSVSPLLLYGEDHFLLWGSAPLLTSVRGQLAGSALQNRCTSGEDFSPAVAREPGAVRSFREILPRIELIELAGETKYTVSTFVGGPKRMEIRYRLRSADGGRS